MVFSSFGHCNCTCTAFIPLHGTCGERVVAIVTHVTFHRGHSGKLYVIRLGQMLVLLCLKKLQMFQSFIHAYRIYLIHTYIHLVEVLHMVVHDKSSTTYMGLPPGWPCKLVKMPMYQPDDSFWSGFESNQFIVSVSESFYSDYMIVLVYVCCAVLINVMISYITVFILH